MGVFTKGNRVYIDYYVNGRRKRESIGPNNSATIRLAKQVLAKRKLEIAEGKFLDKRQNPKVTFTELADRYLEWSKENKKPKTYRNDVFKMGILKRFFGDRLLDSISPFDVERYKLTRRETIKPATVNRDLALLKHMFSMAVDWGMCKDNPVKKVKMFTNIPQRDRWLTEDEFDRLKEACPNNFRPLVECAYHTGMRLGEIKTLTWDRVDLKNGWITLDDTKSNERQWVPINDSLRSVLEKLPKKEGCPYVFLSSRGEPYKATREIFKNACKRAGIEDFRFHDLRHTFATQLALRGADLLTIKRLTRHKSFEMVERYAHYTMDQLKSKVKLLDSKMDTSMDTKVISIGNKGR